VHQQRNYRLGFLWDEKLLHSTEDQIYEVFGQQEYAIQDRASNSISFSATSDLDTMYWHHMIQQLDKGEFLLKRLRRAK
jgi:hypothetical protein